jgi:hypothetical protein
MTNAFLSDDWPVIAANMELSRQDIGLLFSSIRDGWYRPVFHLFLHLCWRLFGEAGWGYHAVIMLLYIILTAFVGNLGEILTQSRRVGLLTAVLFGLHAAHAEPVLWIAAANEVVAGLFAVLSITCYIQFRRSSEPALWLIVAAAFYYFAIAAKETAAFLPLMFLVYDFLFGYLTDRRRRWQRILPPLLLLSIGVGFVIFRFTTGSPYSTSATLSRIPVNLAYYLAIQLFIMPDNYGYLTALPLWRDAPLLPLTAMSMAAVGLWGIVWSLYRRKKSLTLLKENRGALFLIIWSVAALSPVILTASGRTAFISTIGVAGIVAILWVTVWEIYSPQMWPLLFLILFVGANVIVTADRTHWWRQAGLLMESSLINIERELREIPENSKVCLVDLPDHVRHAYVFRTSFPAINERVFPEWDIEVILDSSPPESRQRLCRDENMIFIHFEDLAP